MPERSADRRSPTRGVVHLIIECVTPELDAGRYPVKRVIGDVVTVGADVIKDGHDILAAQVVVRAPSEPARSIPMRFDYNIDRWFGEFTVDEIGRWHFTIEAWTDVWETWRSGFRKKVDAGVDVAVELLEAAQLVRAAARRAKRGPARASLAQSARAFETDGPPTDAAIQRALDPDLAGLMRETFLPRDLTRYGRELGIIVDRERAQFARVVRVLPAVHRSHRTTRHVPDVDRRAPAHRRSSASTSLYLPPIHPIGRTFRKGKNNSLTAGTRRRRQPVGDRERARWPRRDPPGRSGPSTTSTLS